MKLTWFYGVLMQAACVTAAMAQVSDPGVRMDISLTGTLRGAAAAAELQDLRTSLHDTAWHPASGQEANDGVYAELDRHPPPDVYVKYARTSIGKPAVLPNVRPVPQLGDRRTVQLCRMEGGRIWMTRIFQNYVAAAGGGVTGYWDTFRSSQLRRTDCPAVSDEVH